MNVFITGVSSGLGNGIARAVLEAAGEVWGCSRREAVDLSSEFSPRFHFSRVDLANAESGPRAVVELLKGVESLDCVVLNAGILPPVRDLRDTPLESLREVMEVNVWANKWLIDTVLQTVPKVRQVVAISSGASVSGNRGWNGYSVSKAALNMLIRLYATERADIHFSALAPGLVDSAMQDYIASLPEDGRFETVDRLKKAKGTATMPDPLTAGRRCSEVFPALLQEESGGFFDIRKMP